VSLVVFALACVLPARCYGRYGADVLALLMCQPHSALPVVLKGWEGEKEGEKEEGEKEGCERGVVKEGKGGKEG
jgi:hypothetical protein